MYTERARCHRTTKMASITLTKRDLRLGKLEHVDVTKRKWNHSGDFKETSKFQGPYYFVELERPQGNEDDCILAISLILVPATKHFLHLFEAVKLNSAVTHRKTNKQRFPREYSRQTI